MHLSETERLAIIRTISSVDPDATVYLFGSRADDQARGGDIDLFVLSTRIDMLTKLKIVAELHQKLGEQKIDLVVYPDLTKTFARLASERGIKL
jgi:uncharacterized protein